MDYLLLYFILNSLIQKRFYFQCHDRTKMQHMYQNILKYVKGDHKCLRCPDLLYNNFEVLCSEIALDKIDLECAATFKAKPTKNYLGFIIYSNAINFDITWLDSSGYIITQWQKSPK